MTGIDREVDGLYHFPSHLSHEDVTDKNISPMTKGSSSQCMLWHMRMGYPSFKVLK